MKSASRQGRGSGPTVVLPPTSAVSSGLSELFRYVNLIQHPLRLR